MTYIYQSNNKSTALCDTGMHQQSLSGWLGAPASGEVIKVANGILIRGDEPFRPSGHSWDSILYAVAYVETGGGGYNIVNMYDAGILSWGILQWTFHQGSLQKFLQFIKDRIGDQRFRQLFPGLDLIPVKGRPEPDLIVDGVVRRIAVPGEIAKAIQSDSVRWAQIFYQAGKDRTIQALQNEYAMIQLNQLLKRSLHSIGLVREKFPKATFATVGDYLSTNIKGLALFFSMWVNNPSWAYRKFAESVHQLAQRYGKGNAPGTWPSGWQTQLADQFEKDLRATTVGYWGDAKAAQAKRVSRTQKTLNALSEYLKKAPASTAPVNPQVLTPLVKTMVTAAGSMMPIPNPLQWMFRSGSAGSASPSTVQGFTPVPIEVPGGGRITNKKPPSSTDLVTVTGVGGKRVPLHRLAATAWQAMVNAARQTGFAAPLLLPTSGYRSVEHQERLWKAALARYGDEKIAKKYVAKPGGSPHHSGRAIDMWLGINNDSKNIPVQRTLPIYHWLLANAHKFGFYPYEVEPWHWEYNPPSK